MAIKASGRGLLGLAFQCVTQSLASPLRRSVRRWSLALLLVPILTGCPATEEVVVPPKVTLLSVTPSEIGDGEVFTIAWSTSNTTAAHVCRLGLRPSGGGEGEVSAIDVVSCNGSWQHSPGSAGEYQYVLDVLSAGGGLPIARAVSAIVTRRPAGGDEPVPAIDSLAVTPSEIGDGEVFTIAWSTSNTTAAHVCRLGLRPSGGGEGEVSAIDVVSCNGSWQHSPGSAGEYQDVLDVLSAGGGLPITRMSSNIVARKPPQGGAVLWTDQFGTSAYDYAQGVATDAHGNILVAGMTSGSISATNAGGMDVFVRKYDANGNVLWGSQFGTGLEDVGRAVATDPEGNVVVVGSTLGSFASTNAGRDDVLVRKYDPSGNVLWSDQFGTDREEWGLGVATDAEGNIIVVGYTNGALVADESHNADVFVRKYGPHGDILWTDQFGDNFNSNEFARAVATDFEGNIVITGETQGSLIGSSAGNSDVFVRKYGPAGNILWSVQFGTEFEDFGQAITTDVDGNVIIAGSTQGSLATSSAGGSDAFVRKYDPNGNVLWSDQFGTNAEESDVSVAIDPVGNVSIGGTTGGSLFGSSAGQADAFVRRYDPSGNVLWNHQFGTTATEGAIGGVAADFGGNVIIAGYTRGTLMGTNAGFEDAFVRKYAP